MQINDKIAELEAEVDALEKQITDVAKQRAAAPNPLTKSVFDSLVAEEIARGCPASVAGQRVVAVYGANPDVAALRKSASTAVTDFMAAVDEVMIEKRLSRSAAMTEVRKRDAALFAKFQEV